MISSKNTNTGSLEKLIKKRSHPVAKSLDISVFGLGKVGLALASCLSNAGHRVVGVDTDPGHVSKVNGRTIKMTEPGVVDRLSQCSAEQLTATADAAMAVHNSELSFIIVPTPSNALGGFSNHYVLQVCDSIGAALRLKSQAHTIALVSTVLPGSSENIIIPRLEGASGRTLGQGLSYCYNPSFIALGDIVQGIEAPDYVLIGESDENAGNLVLSAHQAMTPPDTPFALMEIVEAEITKLASNAHETMRVSFANMLFDLCSEIPGANVDRVTEALSHRTGKRFFKGAVPYGGPCWPRDNEALSVFMDALGVSSRMPRSVDLFNEEHGRYILRKVLELSSAGGTVGLLGLAYKPGTNIIERSYAIDLARWLTGMRRKVVAWDPLALGDTRRALGDAIDYVDTAEACLDTSDITVIVNRLGEIAQVDWRRAHTKIVVDCWRCIPITGQGHIGNYIPLGQGPVSDRQEWFTARLGNRLESLTT